MTTAKKSSTRKPSRSDVRRDVAYDVARRRRDEKRDAVGDDLFDAMNRYLDAMRGIENAYFDELDVADRKHEASERRERQRKERR
jgi:hypothetical protein